MVRPRQKPNSTFPINVSCPSVTASPPLSLVTSSYNLAAGPQPGLTQQSFLYASGDAGVAQRQSSCFVNRWATSEIEIGPKGPYDPLFINN
jgi:hypothetical protein